MTAIRFSGAWPWWLILLVGVVGSLWIARWYWRESRHLSNPMRWLLPTLRGCTFFLILLMLAGPTLFHQHIEGQLSRIRVLLDVSPSMATVDVDTTGASRNVVGRRRFKNAACYRLAEGTAKAPSRRVAGVGDYEQRFTVLEFTGPRSSTKCRLDRYPWYRFCAR